MHFYFFSYINLYLCLIWQTLMSVGKTKTKLLEFWQNTNYSGFLWFCRFFQAILIHFMLIHQVNLYDDTVNIILEHRHINITITKLFMNNSFYMLQFKIHEKWKACQTVYFISIWMVWNTFINSDYKYTCDMHKAYHVHFMNSQITP